MKKIGISGTGHMAKVHYKYLSKIKGVVMMDAIIVVIIYVLLGCV